MTKANYAARTPEIVVGGLPERRAGWIDWVTTTDHKKIGILYLFTTAFFFLVGGVEAADADPARVTRQHLPRPDDL